MFRDYLRWRARRPNPNQCESPEDWEHFYTEWVVWKWDRPVSADTVLFWLTGVPMLALGIAIADYIGRTY